MAVAWERTGATTTFASGLPLPTPGVGIGGAMDVVFLHHRAYVLVTLVGSGGMGAVWKAADVTLSTEQLKRLDDASEFELGYPYSFIKNVQGIW